MDIREFLRQRRLPQAFTTSAQNWFIPLAERIRMRQMSAKGPFFVAINGAQGSGKSTLTDFLGWYFTSALGCRVATLSLDDVYLSQTERVQHALNIHPLLRTRGVPGTHNIRLLRSTLHNLAAGNHVQLPRFNKAFDNPAPAQEWPSITDAVDIVIVEGWCWGARPQEASALLEPINTLEREQDKTGEWRCHVNEQLRTYYAPLYDLFHYWVMLRAPSFEIVTSWRREQERKLADLLPSAPGLMTASQIGQFVQYFERLTRHCINTLPFHCDEVFQLDEQRHIVELLQPKTEQCQDLI